MKKKKINYLNIIDKIEKVRSKNNINWMDIMRIAFKYSPEEAKKVLKKINTNDTKISNLLKELSK